MPERTRKLASGGPRRRADRRWKDETNPVAKRDSQAREVDGDQPSSAAPEPADEPVAPRRAQAGREDQGQTWQTGPGSGGATQSAGRVKNLESRSDQAGPKK
jgi:hypothetical protein